MKSCIVTIDTAFWAKIQDNKTISQCKTYNNIGAFINLDKLI